MGATTASRNLLGRDIRSVAQALENCYGRPRLGNPRDPIDDLVYVMISVMTTEPSYRRVFKALKASFPTWTNAYRAPVAMLRAVLKPAGLSRMKARALKAIFAALRHRFGRVTLSPLATWRTAPAEEFLASLPGVGIKTSRCVLMYAFGRRVFPVDTHCLRISRRLGWTDATALTARTAEGLQTVIPEALRFGLHVGFVLHGRSVCSAKTPQCSACCIRQWCRGEGRKYHASASRS